MLWPIVIIERARLAAPPKQRRVNTGKLGYRNHPRPAHATGEELLLHALTL